MCVFVCEVKDIKPKLTFKKEKNNKISWQYFVVPVCLVNNFLHRLPHSDIDIQPNVMELLYSIVGLCVGVVMDDKEEKMKI